jgi:hypothetical protein
VFRQQNNVDVYPVNWLTCRGVRIIPTSPNTIIAGDPILASLF